MTSERFRMSAYGSLAIATVALAIITPPALGAASFQGLGDLPGGISVSHAFGISADGAIVVGSSRSAAGDEAFRWTEAGGMVGLGDLPRSASACTAEGCGHVALNRLPDGAAKPTSGNR